MDWLWSRIERKCLALLQINTLNKAALHQIHAFMLRNALDTNLHLVTKFITCLSSRGLTHHARLLFDKIPQRTEIFLCNTMMKSHLTSGQFYETMALYMDLRRKDGFLPDNYMFSTLAKCCGSRFDVFGGMGVHGSVVRFGFESNLYVATALVDMYGKMGLMDLSRRLFDEMEVRSGVSWTALVTGYTRCGDLGSARKMFDEMPEIERDVASFNVMIDGYVKAGEMGLAMAVFNAMPERNVISWTSMIDGYCTVGNVDEARSLFDAMPHRNLYTWNAMIGGYCQNNKPHEALVMFKDLFTSRSFEPDDVTVVSVLPAIADLGALEMGNWVYEFVKRKKLDKSANVSTALVDMYGKCGEIETARRVFDCVLSMETCTWNALINGLAINGRANESLQVFLEMKKKGFKPDEITMLGVLSACNHSGLVDEGRRWFNEMKKLGLIPKIEHYGCLVDLLGRAGRLEEAERLIENMPYEANGIILSSLLFACNSVKDVTRAEKVVKKAIDMEPCNDGNYIMLRNLYASERRWRDVERIKRLMVMSGAKKEAGCSIIEIDGRVLEFVAGDHKIRPKLGITRFVLNQLTMHMKGQDPDLDLK